jgi:hypothetical protein
MLFHFPMQLSSLKLLISSEVASEIYRAVWNTLNWLMGIYSGFHTCICLPLHTRTASLLNRAAPQNTPVKWGFTPVDAPILHVYTKPQIRREHPAYC